MPDYQLAKVFKIVSNDDVEVYIGSTTLPRLCTRLAKYKNDYKCWKEGKSSKISLYDIFDEYGIDNVSIVLLEACPCNSKDELSKRQRHYIETIDNINKYIPGRTDKEYYEETKNKQFLRKRELNKTEKYITQTICPCGGKYKFNSRLKHLESQRHINFTIVQYQKPQDQIPDLVTPEII